MFYEKMKKYGYIFVVMLLSLMLFTSALHAQNNTNSPYSRYGYGDLTHAVSSNSRAMGGLSVGLRDSEHINITNPASYTVMDSLTFLFDGGVTLQNANFSDGTYKQNAKNSSVNYFAMQFRFSKRTAMSIGLKPYSSVGYNVSQYYSDDTVEDNYSSLSFVGDGGLHEIYGGIGLKLFKNLSVGANFSYIWGDINHYIQQAFPANSYAIPFNRTDNVDVRSFKFDLGAQYEHRINSRNLLVIGATFSPKQSLSNKSSVVDQLGNSTTGYTTTETRDHVTCEIPMSVGLGATYRYDQRILVGADLTYQKWEDVKYASQDGLFCDEAKVSVGGEYLPNLYGRSFFANIKYRFGAFYSLPYYKINGKRAANEFGISGGFGLPAPRSGSVINLSAQYIRVQGKDAAFLDENILQVTVGLTFNERWFFKRRVN